MRILSPTYRQVINLTTEGYNRVLRCSNGIGKGMFVEMVLDYAAEAGVQPPPDFHPSRLFYPQVSVRRGEEPSVLGGRIESVVSRMKVPPRATAARDELLLDLPRTALLQHARWAIREGWFPHESLGESIETALRNIEHRMSGVEPTVETVGAPVDMGLYRRVSNLLSRMELNVPSVIADEFVAVIKRRSLG